MILSTTDDVCVVFYVIYTNISQGPSEIPDATTPKKAEKSN